MCEADTCTHFPSGDVLSPVLCKVNGRFVCERKLMMYKVGSLEKNAVHSGGALRAFSHFPGRKKKVPALSLGQNHRRHIEGSSVQENAKKRSWRNGRFVYWCWKNKGGRHLRT